MEQDHAEAVRLYGLAAAQGYAAAQFNLGFCYEIMGMAWSRTMRRQRDCTGWRQRRGSAAAPVQPGLVLQ